MRRFIIFVLILAVLGVAGYAVIQKLKSEYTVNYQAYTAATGTISNSLSFSGTLQAVNNTTYTAASDGTVRALYAEKGEDVKEGDVLLRFATGKTLTADFDGRINQLNVSEGDEVKEGDTLLQLVDFERMRVSIRVEMVLRAILIKNSFNTEALASSAQELLYNQSLQDLLKYCFIVVSTLPILVLYPFVKKYFVKGVMIGAVKG